MNIKANSRYPEIHKSLSSGNVGMSPWEGDVFRAASLDYPKSHEILSGEGSYRHGGRWNAAGSCRAVYGSPDDVTAVAESRAMHRYYGMPYRSTRLLVIIRVRVAKALDLTNSGQRRKLKITRTKLLSEDWRKINHGGHESLTQAIGRAAEQAGVEDLLVPSASVKKGLNVVYFPGNLSPESRVHVLDSERLDELPGK